MSQDGESTEPLPTVFADFNNADRLGRLRLNCRGSIDDFQALGLEPHDGLRLVLSDDDEFSTEGVVRWDAVEGWVAEIDWSKL